MTYTVEHSLQVVTQEFKIHEPKKSKLKGRYSTKATHICNSRIKDIDMSVWDHNQSEHKAVQLDKDYITEHAYGVVESYLDMNDQWSYSKLIEHLRMLF